MERFTINGTLGHIHQFFSRHDVHLPPFINFPLIRWRRPNATTRSEMLDPKLGWDVTVLGGNNFTTQGSMLSTLYSGSPKGTLCEECYIEKTIHVHGAQVTPVRFHWCRREDIINHGDGNLIVEL